MPAHRCASSSTRSTRRTGRRPPGSSWRSGWAIPSPSTALHGRGTGDLLDEVVSLLPLPTEGGDPGGQTPTPSPGLFERAPDPALPRVAIIGRPNVGKSTLFNKLLGEERSIVHDMPGTTRDAIDTVVETPDGPVCFIDTAGLRRPSKTDRGTEQHATLRALRALERADVAILVIDATVGASHQDQRLAERIGVSGCPAIVALNKWDQVPTEDRDDVLAGVGDRLAFLGAAPVLKMSALSGKGVHRILPALRDSVQSYHQRVPTGALNRAVQELQARQAAPRAKIRYIVQGAIDPPTFTLFTNGRLHADVSPLHRAGAPREVRLRLHAHEAPRDGSAGDEGLPDLMAWCRGVRRAHRRRGPGGGGGVPHVPAPSSPSRSARRSHVVLQGG